MWLTPASTAARRTAIAALKSRGGAKACGPANCIAPYPMRFRVIDEPGRVKLPARSVCGTIPPFSHEILRDRRGFVVASHGNREMVVCAASDAGRAGQEPHRDE